MNNPEHNQIDIYSTHHLRYNSWRLLIPRFLPLGYFFIVANFVFRGTEVARCCRNSTELKTRTFNPSFNYRMEYVSDSF